MSVNNVSNTSTAAYTSNVYQNNYKYNANTAKTDDKDKDKNQGVVYEKGNAASKSVYAKEDVVARMKKDAEDRTNQLRSLVQQMMGNQGGKIGQADDMWRFLAKGDFTVSPEVRAQAQKDIADDAYWAAEEKRAAFEKGFKAATKSWGKELPSISQRTYDAVMDKFDDWAGVETKA